MILRRTQIRCTCRQYSSAVLMVMTSLDALFGASLGSVVFQAGNCVTCTGTIPVSEPLIEGMIVTLAFLSGCLILSVLFHHSAVFSLPYGGRYELLEPEEQMASGTN